jgi:DNA invertase Pin-like site-specific DNA recombinase
VYDCHCRSTQPFLQETDDLSSSEKDIMAQISELNRQLHKERMKRAKEKKQKEVVRIDPRATTPSFRDVESGRN